MQYSFLMAWRPAGTRKCLIRHTPAPTTAGSAPATGAWAARGAHGRPTVRTAPVPGVAR
jgi:hypothetical protein